MLLSDHDILERLEDGSIEIDPINDLDQQLQPATFDVRLSNEFLVFNADAIDHIDPRTTDPSEYIEHVEVPEGEAFMLAPGDFVLGSTVERVSLPDDVLSILGGRSSWGRLAVVIHATAGIIDPGWNGEITLELSNLGPLPVMLWPGDRIGQLMFKTLQNPADRPYGVERGSHYNGQSGPVGSRINAEGGR